MEWSEPSLVQYEFQFGAKRQAAVARLGFPRPDEAYPGEWVCSFQIQGMKDNEIRKARADDGLQALTIAASAIRRSLDRLKIIGSSNVMPYEIVFPRVVPIGYGEDFYWKLCKILDREIEKKQRQLSERRRPRKKST
jgi:hypothetical protein